MSNQLKYEGLKFDKGSVAKVADPLAVEQALQININSKPFTVVMQTPGAEREITFGLLYSEDVLKPDSIFTFAEKKNERGIIEEMNVVVDEKLLGKGYLSARSLLSVSSCGICGKQELNDVNPDAPTLNVSEKIKLSDILAMHKKMFDAQQLFIDTGGCHGVAAFDVEGNMLALHEDIGRHNALDKVLGHIVAAKYPSAAAAILLLSGRISFELVQKAARTRIPIIAAVGAPSSLAIELAEELGITLVGFLKGDKCNVYAHPNRISI